MTSSPNNPCRVRGAASAKPVKQIGPASLPELTALVVALPPRYRALALLAAWCGLRFGELAALSRADLDRTNGIVRVRRAVVRVNGQASTGTPKSAARGPRRAHSATPAAATRRTRT